MMGLEGGIFVVNTGFEQEDRATIDEGWEMVQRNVSKISHIARDLLFCSKERVPKLEENVSPKAIARDVHDLFRVRCENEGIELRLRVGEGEDKGIFDASAIHNLLANLVANAIDACRFDESSDGKQHAISLLCTQDHAGDILIKVTDNGCGIPEDDRDKVFESFFSSKGTEGTGLGLLVVQQVVKEHGGTITFDTEEGEGTTFFVSLPLRKETDGEGKPQTTSGFFHRVRQESA
jgi:signal transduction histidine kinase